MADIRHRVLTALALNRTPGFNFTGNFLGIRFDHISPKQTRVSLTPGPFCEDGDGQLPLAVLAVLADIALASVVRANLTPEQRLGTVSLHLQMNGGSYAGPLSATGTFEGFLDSADARQGLSRLSLMASDRQLLSGHGAFMVLDPPPGVTMYPIVSADHDTAIPLEIATLDDSERAILARADAALASATEERSFIQHFWELGAVVTRDGAHCTISTGPHIGNRVGHMQGGLQLGLAASTANTALGQDWMLASLSASFISPGIGRKLHARSRVVHRGARTALVRTVIVGKNRRRVLDAMSTHARRSE